MNRQQRMSPDQGGLLRLPEEILLQILGYFTEPANKWHDSNKWRYPNELRANHPNGLQNARLACRRLNEVLSPLLCPVVTVNLESCSLHHADMLSRNALIAKGIRGLEINLRYRSSRLAADICQYHVHVVRKFVDDAYRECDWHTEFQSYEDEDESPEATKHRAYQKAERVFELYSKHWREYVEQPHADRLVDVQEDQSTVRANQRLLQEFFDSYAERHDDQLRIVSDGSFVRTLVEVISRLKNVPFIWFTDSDQFRFSVGHDVFELSSNKDSLCRRMEAAHNWLEIESLHDTGTDLYPVRILTDLPIACHEAAIQLKGLSVGCFPLTKGFEYLLPVSATTDVASEAWARFTVACQSLEKFHFGMNGMSCTPFRPNGFTPSHRLFIDRFTGAACSGPNLEHLCLSMTPFRLTDGRHASSKPDQHYRAGSILNSLTSTRLLELQILSVQIDSIELEAAIDRLSSSARSIFLTGITLEHGQYANAMAALQQKVARSQLQVEFNSLEGAEFGPATKFVDDGCFGLTLDEESREDYWERLEEHMNPMLLKRTLEWIRNGQGRANPLGETSCS